MKLLLHVCCAPCLIYPLEELKREGFQTSAIFYNPNIHPFLEYERRKNAIENLFNHVSGKIEIVYPAYDPADFFKKINSRGSRQERCFSCWGLRLNEVARVARRRGFGYFSTTLLVSPYQDQDSLRDIGNQAAGKAGIKFYYRDFRPGFRDAHQKARAQGLYCQKYCGCLYSQVERFKEKKKKWEKH